MESENLKVAQAAEVLEVHPITVRRLDQKGILKSRRNYLGHRVFRLDDVLKLKRERETLQEDPPECQAVI